MLPAADIALESKVAFLRQPTSYTEPAYRVEAIETHMSWIFLTDGYAYKLKKPVRYDFLDFSTLAARRFYCDEEVRLNRRLAADVYLGVVGLNLDAGGHLQLGGETNAIDWLVKMRRLPTRQMLDYAIRHRSLTDHEMVKVAARLAGFYASSASIPVNAQTYRQQLQERILFNREQLIKPEYRLPVEHIERICAAQLSALQNMGALFDERVLSGKIVEGHGDLRPEHICLNATTDIIDCLEFSFDLRVIDPADELAFLALECERLGAPDAGALLLRTYSELSGDMPAPELIDFYQSYRACLRAAIAIRHLDEEQFRYSPQWPQRAKQYLRLAAQHIVCCELEQLGD